MSWETRADLESHTHYRLHGRYVIETDAAAGYLSLRSRRNPVQLWEGAGVRSFVLEHDGNLWLPDGATYYSEQVGCFERFELVKLQVPSVELLGPQAVELVGPLPLPVEVPIVIAREVVAEAYAVPMVPDAHYLSGIIDALQFSRLRVYVHALDSDMYVHLGESGSADMSNQFSRYLTGVGANLSASVETVLHQRYARITVVNSPAAGTLQTLAVAGVR
jgi:hypothetical protein